MCDFCIRLERYKTKNPGFWKSWGSEIMAKFKCLLFQNQAMSYKQAIVRMQRPNVYNQRIMGSALWMFMPIILKYAQKNTPRSWK